MGVCVCVCVCVCSMLYVCRSAAFLSSPPSPIDLVSVSLYCDFISVVSADGAVCVCVWGGGGVCVLAVEQSDDEPSPASPCHAGGVVLGVGE